MATTLESALTAAVNTGHTLPFQDVRRGPDAPNFGVYGGIKEEYLFDDVRRGTYKGIGRNQHSFRPKPGGIVEQSLFTSQETNRIGKVKPVVKAPKGSMIEAKVARPDNIPMGYNLFEGHPTALEEARTRGIKTWQVPDTNKKLPTPAKPIQNANVFSPDNLAGGINKIQNMSNKFGNAEPLNTNMQSLAKEKQARESIAQEHNASLAKKWQEGQARHAKWQESQNNMSVEEFFSRDTSIRQRFENKWNESLDVAKTAAEQKGEKWAGSDLEKEFNNIKELSENKLNQGLERQRNAYIDAHIGTSQNVDAYKQMISSYQGLSMEGKVNALENNNQIKELADKGIISKETGAVNQSELENFSRQKLLDLEENSAFREELAKYQNNRVKLGAAENATDKALKNIVKNEGKGMAENVEKAVVEGASHLGKYGAAVAGVAAGALATAGLVFAMSDSRGSQSNAQLYGQAPAYAN